MEEKSENIDNKQIKSNFGDIVHNNLHEYSKSISQKEIEKIIDDSMKSINNSYYPDNYKSFITYGTTVPNSYNNTTKNNLIESESTQDANINTISTTDSNDNFWAAPEKEVRKIEPKKSPKRLYFDPKDIIYIGVGKSMDIGRFDGRIHNNRFPIIVSDYDSFCKTIEELFGKFDKPTPIPVYLLVNFELEDSHKNLDFKIHKNSYEENSYQIAPKERSIMKLQSLEKSGYNCTKWLTDNNYIVYSYETFALELSARRLMNDELYMMRVNNNYQ